MAVPFRGLYFSDDKAQIMKLIAKFKFPSPFGDYIFQTAEIETEIAKAKSSRPLSGLISFRLRIAAFFAGLGMFPSPFGAYILQTRTYFVRDG